MTYVNVGSLQAQPGRGADLVALLTRPNPDLVEAGCLLYEVGVSPEEADLVLVSELWPSAEAHLQSLQLASVQGLIAEARPLLTGEMGGFRYEAAGSPLRSA